MVFMWFHCRTLIIFAPLQFIPLSDARNRKSPPKHCFALENNSRRLIVMEDCKARSGHETDLR